ncbi:MAG: glycosyltransferase family 4 protein [Candidatus Pacebacteria bacterium]|nr:glycosyltransferase family 4 protein [Candidatus Paceibacterota bacterium]
MKILMISDYVAPIGGAEIYMKNLSKLLMVNGHEVDTWGSDLTEKKDQLFSVANPYFFLKLARILREKRYDIIHIHSFISVLSPLVLAAIAIFNNSPVVMHIHNSLLICPFSGVTDDYKICPDHKKIFSLHKKCKRPLKRKSNLFYDLAKLFRFSLSRYLAKKIVNIFICPSISLSKLIKESLFLEEKEIVTLPYFVEKSVKIKSETKTKIKNNQLVFVGRISKEKGLDVAIKAVSLLLEESDLYKNILFKIVGDGPDFANLLDLTKKLGCSNSVRFVGRVDNDKVDNYYQESIALIVPSLWIENSPVAIYEAMRNKRPIVASNIGGLTDLVLDNKNGFLFKTGDCKSLAKAIKKIYGNSEKSIKMGAFGFERLKNEYGAEKHYSEIINLYKRINKEHKKNDKR